MFFTIGELDNSQDGESDSLVVSISDPSADVFQSEAEYSFL